MSLSKLSKKAELLALHFLRDFGPTLAALGCFFLPIRLSLAYIFLIPLISFWVLSTNFRLFERLETLPGPIIKPFAWWFCITALSSIFGLYPLRSISQLLSLGFYFLLVPTTVHIVLRSSWRSNISEVLSVEQVFSRIWTLLTALVVGHSFVALYTILTPYLPIEYSDLFGGSVTKSGQLGITIPLLAVTLISQRIGVENDLKFMKSILLSALLCICAASTGFESLNPLWFIILLLAIVTLGFWQTKTKPLLSTTALPLLIANLIVNLKRGPWLGVILSMSFFLLRGAKVRWLIILTLVASSSLLYSPVRERLSKSYDHFAIAGGRGVMWEIGVELAAKYPLGIGYHNSRVMQQLDPEIPPFHRHFHNNLLNILVETGWIGLGAFIWWIYSIVTFCFRKNFNRELSILPAVGTAFLSWQLAGLVEYNFGDSEIFILAMICLGFIGAVQINYDLLIDQDRPHT